MIVNNNTTVRVLLVEDNHGDALLIKKSLESASGHTYLLTQTETLEGALSELSNQKFDIVLLDLNLPDSERLHTINAVSAATNTAIIALTSDPEVAMGIKAIQIGIQDYLGKDKIRSEEFIQTIEFAIKRQDERNKLYSLAYREELTGLPNRNAFLEKCQDILNESSPSSKSFAVYALRLSNLKEIIMEYGLPLGESVLKTMSARLYGLFQSDKFLARLEGEDFALLQPSIDHAGHALYTARRIFENFEKEFQVKGQTVQVHMKAGIALYPDHGMDVEMLLNNATLALDEALMQDGTPYAVFNG